MRTLHLCEEEEEKKKPRQAATKAGRARFDVLRKIQTSAASCCVFARLPLSPSPPPHPQTNRREQQRLPAKAVIRPTSGERVRERERQREKERDDEENAGSPRN